MRFFPLQPAVLVKIKKGSGNLHLKSPIALIIYELYSAGYDNVNNDIVHFTKMTLSVLFNMAITPDGIR